MSLALLISLITIHYYDYWILKLEIQWLVVSTIPLIVALLIGGYIEGIKGFGLELKTSLRKPLGIAEISLEKYTSVFLSLEKGSIQNMQMMPEERKKSVEVIILVIGKQYDSQHLFTYFQNLPSLKYIEVRSERSGFLALLPTTTFQLQQKLTTPQPEPEKIMIELLITAFSKSDTEKTLTDMRQIWGDDLIEERIYSNCEVIEVARTMKNKRVNHIAVTNEDNKFIGVLELRSIEKAIFDKVVASMN